VGLDQENIQEIEAHSSGLQKHGRLVVSSHTERTEVGTPRAEITTDMRGRPHRAPPGEVSAHTFGEPWMCFHSTIGVMFAGAS
jgi:hypothetical protein